MKQLSMAFILATSSITMLVGPAFAQSLEKRAQQFKAYLGSLDYSTFLAQKALDNDKLLPPACGKRRLTGRRQLFAVYQTPRFIRTRKVPIRGAWAERVEVARCGKTVLHNIYLSASPKRGIHAVAGFPGTTVTRVGTQLAAGKQLIAAVRAQIPSCRKMDILNTVRTTRQTKAGASWREVWTVYACGRSVRRTMVFTPAGKAARVRILR